MDDHNRDKGVTYINSSSSGKLSKHQKQFASCLGPVSSFTHQAALLAFSPEQWEIQFAVTIGDVFRQVQEGSTSAGVIPLANSSNGIVTYTFDDLADQHGRYPDIEVSGDIYLGVQHCLLGHRPSSSIDEDEIMSDSSSSLDLDSRLNTTDSCLSLQYIQVVYSHPQAVDQCKKLLSTHLKHARVVAVSSTSKAAEMVSLDRSGTSSAICNIMAAKTFGLDVLVRSVQDRDDNTTRFITIVKGNAHCDTRVANAERDTRPATRYCSLYSFTLIPGLRASTLIDVLKQFDALGASLVDVNTRPSLTIPFHNTFIAEFEESDYARFRYDRKRDLSQLDSMVQSWKWLGIWKKD